MTISFEKIPATLDELKALPEAGLKEPEYGAALFIAAMMNYKDDPDLAISMLEFLKGPGGVSPFEKQFLKDRLGDGKARSELDGVKKENGILRSLLIRLGFEKEML